MGALLKALMFIFVSLSPVSGSHQFRLLPKNHFNRTYATDAKGVHRPKDQSASLNRILKASAMFGAITAINTSQSFRISFWHTALMISELMLNTRGFFTYCSAARGDSSAAERSSSWTRLEWRSFLPILRCTSSSSGCWNAGVSIELLHWQRIQLCLEAATAKLLLPQEDNVRSPQIEPRARIRSFQRNSYAS